MTEVSNMNDYLDIRDIIDRVEQLESDSEDNSLDESETLELRTLSSLLSDLKGCGGDYQWKGDWYPVTLVRDSYWKDYAIEFAEDVGALSDTASWPHNCIDWDRAARELQYDYSSVEFDGVTYWYR